MLELFTRRTDMVWLLLAFGAEIVITLDTADSMHTHVDGCRVADRLASGVLLIKIYVSLVDLHNRTTWTLSKILVDKHHFAQLLCFDVFFVLLGHVIVDLHVLDDCMASWACARTAVQSSDTSLFLQAFNVHAVETFCRL